MDMSATVTMRPNSNRAHASNVFMFLTPFFFVANHRIVASREAEAQSIPAIVGLELDIDSALELRISLDNARDFPRRFPDVVDLQLV